MYQEQAKALGPRGGIGSLWMHVRGTGVALRQIQQAEGIGALWRGIGATIVGAMPARAIYFSAYGGGMCKFLTALLGKQWLADKLNGGKEGPLIHLTAAATAGICTATATNPIWMVKTRMQLHKGHVGVWECTRDIWQSQGLRGLYKGLTASYLGVAESTAQWVIYEQLKQTARTVHQREQLSPIDYFLTAAVAKLCAAVVAYPHEVVRTRLREDSHRYRGLWQTFHRVWVEGGVPALYGGMTAHLLRVVPNSAIMFLCYEALMQAYSGF